MAILRERITRVLYSAYCRVGGFLFCRIILFICTLAQTESVISEFRHVTIRNKSGFIGVVWNNKEQKWQSFIGVNGKSKYLGSFQNIDDAIAARKSGELKYWGNEKIVLS